MSIKQYAERDAMKLDQAGGYYCRHVSAMTAEQLNSKGDIAAELGWRDMQIARLNEQVQALAALAEERREFIVNGVGLGYIQIPAIPFDKAIDTYERCLLKPKFAADAILNEVRAQGCEMFVEFNRKLAKDYPMAMVAKALEVTELNGEQFAARIRAREVPNG